MIDKQDINWGAISGFVAFVLFISLFYILYTAQFSSLNQFYDDYFLGDPRGSIFETFFTIFASLFILAIMSAVFLLFLFCTVETFKAIDIGVQKLQDRTKQYNEKNQKTKAEKGSTTTERNK